jgi:hypothetical protein
MARPTSAWRNVPVTRRLITAVCAAALIASVSVSTVLAGEINGTGSKTHYSQGRSICKFSGLNDDPSSTNPENPGGRVQSYGYSFVRNGLKGVVPSPGFACNPNNGFGG